MNITVIENVLKLNDEIAGINRATLDAAGVFGLNLIGSPGCGKTALLERTLTALGDRMTSGVLAGDLATTRDAERLARSCPHVRQINTGNGCHLDANQVRQGLDTLPLANLDLLVIENVGNLICPVGFDLGQSVKVGMFSVTEGSDKAAKHPRLVLEADLLLLNKVDLLGLVDFDLEVFRGDVASIRDDIALIELSAVRGEGIDQWLEWLTRAVTTRQSEGGALSAECAG